MLIARIIKRTCADLAVLKADMTSIQSDKFLSTGKVLGGASGELQLNNYLLSAIEKIVGIEKFNDIMTEIGPPWPEANEIIEHLFTRLGINWTIENAEALAGLDEKPKVFVANHPYGLPDALGMFSMLTRYRPRIRLFANTLLAATQLSDDRLLYVDPFMADSNRKLNRKSVAAAIKHLRAGGDLALFPGRICSHLKTSDWTISDSEWTDQVHRFVEVSGGEMVPMHISGRNSMLFNLSGLIHPKIRTYMLLREFLRGGHDFRFRIGEPLDAEQLALAARAVSPGAFSRSLTYALKSNPGSVILPQGVTSATEPQNRLDPKKRLPAATLSTDRPKQSGKHIEKLVKSANYLASQNGFSVYCVEKDISDELLDVICEVRFAAYSSEARLDNPRQLLDRGRFAARRYRCGSSRLGDGRSESRTDFEPRDGHVDVFQRT